MSDIVLALKPKWLNLILSGEKTAEFRRALPRDLHDGDCVLLYHGRKIHGCAYVDNVIRVNRPPSKGHKIGVEYLAEAYAEEGKIDSQAAYNYLLGGSRPGVIILSDVEAYTPPWDWRGAPVQNYVYDNYNY